MKKTLFGLGAVALGIVCFFLAIGAVGATISGSAGGAAGAWIACVAAAVGSRRLAALVSERVALPQWRWPLVALAAGIGVQQAYLRWPQSDPAVVAAERAKSEAERAEAEKARVLTNLQLLGEQIVKAKLKDPDSAQFRNQFIGASKAPCGEVNSKNSFGGYGGFRRYVVASKEVVAIEGDNMDQSEFAKVWSTVCKK